jgi:hypothetical protein
MTQAAYPTSSRGYSEAFEVHVSKLRMIGMVFLAALMTAGAIWCTGQPSIKAQLAGWAGSFFFGLGFLYLLWNVGRMEPVLVINAEGVDYRTLGVGMVPWEHVTDVGVGAVSVHASTQKFLCFTLLDETPYLAKLPWYRRGLAAANRAMGFPLLSVTFTGMTRTLDDAVQAVNTFRPAT